MKHQPILVDDWQQEIIDYDGNILLNKGRRIGATHIMGRKAIEYLMKHKNNHPSSQIICVSLTEDQAQLIIMFALQYVDEKYSKYLGKGRDKPTQSRIVLVVNGNRRILKARPVGNTGDAIRGFEGQVLMVDEASRMPEMFWIAATPILMTQGGVIWMWSTPHGKVGRFWDAFQNKNKRYRVWTKNSEKVINDRPISKSWTQPQREAAIRYLEEEKEEMSALQYGQEYMALFLEDLQRFFDDKLIDRCCILKRNPQQRKEDNYMGVDIARMGNDESSFEIFNTSTPSKIMQIENITTKKTLTTETEYRIKELTMLWDLKKVGIDAGSGSLGVGIYDHLLQDPITKSKVIPMNNRTISLDRHGEQQQRIFKEDLYDNMKAMMEHGEILFLDDENLHASFRCIQFEFVKDRGQITKVRIFGDYSHIVEGCIRGAWLAKKEKSKKFFIKTI